jgi:membrane protease YdiL (CAAX protease family)
VSLGTYHLANLPLADAYPEFVSRWVLSQGVVFQAGILVIALAVVATTVVGPFVEELIFRGLILPSWEARWGTRWAVAVSSLLFAVMHLADMAGALLFGVVTAVAYLRTRMLLVPFLIHASTNAAAWLSALVYEVLPGESPFATLEAFRSHWWMGVVGLLLGVPWLWHLLRSLPEPPTQAGTGEPAAGGQPQRVDLRATPR